MDSNPFFELVIEIRPQDLKFRISIVESRSVASHTYEDRSAQILKISICVFSIDIENNLPDGVFWIASFSERIRSLLRVFLYFGLVLEEY